MVHWIAPFAASVAFAAASRVWQALEGAAARR
jgi:hypothetical protein